MKYVEDIRDIGDSLDVLQYLEIVRKMSKDVRYVICTHAQFAYLEQALPPQERKYYGDGDAYYSLGMNIEGRIILRCKADPK